MKTQELIYSHSIRRLLLMVPVIGTMGFAACSDIAGTSGTHATANLQTAAAREPRTDDNVTIGRSTYDSEDRDFDRPWPFGPESSTQ